MSLKLTPGCQRHLQLPHDSSQGAGSGRGSAPENRLQGYIEPCRTFIPLLALTPFFMRLESEQLMWVMDNSQEWMAGSETPIVSNHDAGRSIWILVDGSWRVEYERQHFTATRSDAGCWFGSEEMPAFKGRVRLVTTSPSYILNMTNESLREMLELGFDIRKNLDRGIQYYHRLMLVAEGEAGDEPE
ncbi:hypothetical protein DES53_101636 [Roseimicrobium gellanilyticum]|uniref:Cyclic nucleotide-binding domain-containing protein n=1 Tax=Roseimicrobium gellanilyticum TaxID=748857 RepID=A0A366HU76_9BACT|nr:hypothetical protein [Roseimicrobium gellanilyticum]RBP47836.1 hypothetical protein DES53_101636 [Roseimicrobium gellanilyticum]